MIKRLSCIFLFFLIVSLSFSENEITLEKLEDLKQRNLISLSDYLFLKEELDGTLEEKYFFNLSINRTSITNSFPIINKNEKIYVSLNSFFKETYFKNYTFSDNVLHMILGIVLQEITIDFNTLKIFGSERTSFDKEDFFFKDEDIYLESTLFSDLFLDAINIDFSQNKVSMSTRYTIKNEINRLLKLQEYQLNKEREKNTFFYTNSREFFDLGYIRTNLEKTFSKVSGKKNSGWDGFLEYQGPFLYGEFTTEYNLKNSEFTGVNLHYPNLPYNHFLDISGVNLDGNKWEKSILFEKDKGFFEEGKNFIIRESVPVGSRVELIYLGATIDIAYEENGVVEFRNSELKSDREYTLRVHTRDGKIFTKTIKTNDDFNQQNIGEIQYRFFSTENINSKKTDLDTGIYYGLTDHLTFGGKYFKTSEYDDNGYITVERAKGEIVYSNHIGTKPVSIVLGGEKLISPNNFKRDLTLEALTQIKFEKFKIRYERGYFSEYYNSKDSQGITLEYNPWSFLRIDSSYQWLKDWNGNSDHGLETNIELSQNWNNFLGTLEFRKDIKDEQIYSANLYYTGYRDYSVKWINSFNENSGNFESSISIFNRARKNGFNYSFEVGYTEQEREKVTFRFSIEYDNWFNLNFISKDSGDYETALGLDRVMDLKDIFNPLDNMDVSRVKVQTYLDINNNNIFDEDEFFIGDVEIEINGEQKVTSSNEPIYFYGVPNNILYNLDPKVRRPGFDVFNSKFSLKGKGGGNIEVLIPVNPLFSITGQLAISDDYNDPMSLYEGVVIKVLDSNKKVIANVLPDFMGYYDFSNLSTGKYTIEISSFKNKSIAPFRAEIDIKYKKESGNVFIFNTVLENNRFKIIDK